VTRAGTAPHLLTPGHALAFYEAAFAALASVERDVLRGETGADAETTLATLANEAALITTALGPVARSGDREYQLAVERLDRVEEYIRKIRLRLEEGPSAHRDRPKSWWRRVFERDGG
jgi:hypothetical protein